MAETKSKKPKFKYTRELVRIALDDGMTQEEIARICRVQQSVVSGWKNGSSRANVEQIAELKKRYGNRLNRTTSRVYLALTGPRSDVRWEDTELARRLEEIRGKVAAAQWPVSKPGIAVKAGARKPVSVLESSEPTLRDIEAERRQLQDEILPGEPELHSLDTLNTIARQEFEAARQQVQVVQVEGPVVLRYTFVRIEVIARKTLELVRVPIARWLVHRQVNGHFVLVCQARRVLTGRALWKWRNVLVAVDEGVQNGSSFAQLADGSPFVECADDAARWLSSILGPMDAAALLAHGDAYFSDPRTLHGPHDEETLPFLLKRMLIDHGHEVPGVARIGISE